MDKEAFLRRLAEVTKRFVEERVDSEIEPYRKLIQIMQHRLDHAEARLAELEAARQPQGQLRQIR